jgi:hypothetical protein
LQYASFPDSVTQVVFLLILPSNFSNRRMTNCFAGAYLFPAEDKPKYLLGFGVIAGMCAFGVMVYALAHVLFRRYIK